ncbi:MAG: TonB-dependent receptor, partial [Hyphomicrobium sp.]
DATLKVEVAPGIRHTLLAGTEFTHQETENNRNTPHFGTPDGPATLTVPFTNPTVFAPVFFNEVTRRRETELNTQSVYVQDQLEIGRYLELIGGIRFDRFDVDFTNNRNGDTFSRVDNVWSPRAGAVFKPSETISLYVSTSRSFLPSAGDQFNVLDVTSSTLEPEEFENKEIGFKWDVLPRLTFTGALFQLDRKNQVVASGPFAGQQVGESRTEGGELALTGYMTDQWQVSAGYGHQIAEVVAGRPEDIGHEIPWVPHNTFSLWNKYQFTPMWAAGIGVVHKTDFFAALNNEVQIPGYTRVDAALYLTLNETWNAQINVENLLNEDYFAAAHNNNNIMPGAPTSVYLTVGAKF